MSNSPVQTQDFSLRDPYTGLNVPGKCLVFAENDSQRNYFYKAQLIFEYDTQALTVPPAGSPEAKVADRFRQYGFKDDEIKEIALHNLTKRICEKTARVAGLGSPLLKLDMPTPARVSKRYNSPQFCGYFKFRETTGLNPAEGSRPQHDAKKQALDAMDSFFLAITDLNREMCAEYEKNLADAAKPVPGAQGMADVARALLKGLRSNEVRTPQEECRILVALLDSLKGFRITPGISQTVE